MKKCLILLILTIIYAAITPTSYAMDYDKAMTQKKPVILYVYMTGCSACKAFDSYYKKAEKEYSQKYNFVKENVYFSKIADTLKINSVPAVFILDTQKKTAARIKWECLSDRACFEQTLKEYEQN